MAVKRRKLKKHRNIDPFREMYERLRTDGSDDVLDSIILAIYDAWEMCPTTTYLVVEETTSRISTEINTLQMNYPDNIVYRVQMSWTDYKGKRRFGRPPVTTRVTSHRRMIRAVLMCYLLLCQTQGRFL